MAGTLNLRRN